VGQTPSQKLSYFLVLTGVSREAFAFDLDAGITGPRPAYGDRYAVGPKNPLDFTPIDVSQMPRHGANDMLEE
jgi:hypothetical protein